MEIILFLIRKMLIGVQISDPQVARRYTCSSQLLKSFKRDTELAEVVEFITTSAYSSQSSNLADHRNPQANQENDETEGIKTPWGELVTKWIIPVSCLVVKLNVGSLTAIIVHASSRS